MFEQQIPMKEHTTLKVGGPADFFAVAETEAQLVEIVRAAKEKDLAIHILGGGSNIFVPDCGVRGLVIKNVIKGIVETDRGDQVLLTVGAGEVFDTLVAHSVEKHYWGLENLSHIPGSVGATPIQNVGAYGVEVQDTITEVRVFNTETLTFQTLSNQDCQFGYRDSLFKSEDGAHYIVVSVTYMLSKTPEPRLSYKDLARFFNNNPNPTLSDIRAAVIGIRSKKFPDWTTVGTAGSFFKNPILDLEIFTELQKKHPDIPHFKTETGGVKVPLGWILDKICNVRGVSIGGVGSYEGQALVIVNDGSATAADIEVFANYIAKLVLEKTNINIEWEVTRME